jgi:hypothetical protein
MEWEQAEISKLFCQLAKNEATPDVKMAILGSTARVVLQGCMVKTYRMCQFYVRVKS